MRISKQEFQELLDRYLNNTASAKERQMLDRFFDSYKPSSGEDLVRGRDHLDREMLQNIHARLNLSPGSRGRKTIRFWVPLAAAIGLFVMAVFLIGDITLFSKEDLAALTVEQRTARGEKVVAQLPDGTLVHLNGESRITYPDNFNEKSRDITLNGEAYFEVVSSSKPFTVHTAGMKAQVLGTSFNIKTRGEEDIEVTLVKGSLKVESKSGESVLLKPNEQAVVAHSGGEVMTRAINVFRYVSWKDNILFFEKTSLKEAIATLERWYNVNITTLNPAVEGCVITAKYQGEPLGNVLSSFQFLLNLKINRLEEGQYTIDGKGCK